MMVDRLSNYLTLQIDSASRLFIKGLNIDKPLTLDFHAPMGTRFFEGHFHLPALHKVIENESRRGMYVGAQQRLRFELPSGSRIKTQRSAITGMPE